MNKFGQTFLKPTCAAAPVSGKISEVGILGLHEVHHFVGNDSVRLRRRLGVGGTKVRQVDCISCTSAVPVPSQDVMTKAA